MTAPAVAPSSPTIRLSPSTIVSIAAAALAWAAVIAIARHMGNAVGTMELSFAEFVGMWALMMTAMMLPAVSPVASLYARTIPIGQPRRWLSFVAGYLFVWSSVGVPVYFVLRVLDGIESATSVRAIASVVLAAAGIYQLTPLKAVCLRHCRSPLGQLLRYGNITGRFKDLKVAVHHAAYCLGCCWVLMAIFFAFGIMNLWVMIGLAAVVVGEKVLRHGETIGRLAGSAFVALALLIAVSSPVADALLPSTVTQMSSPMNHM
jgi:predicted metal-binding membrane protein